MVGRGLREVTSRRFHCGPPKHLLRVGLPWLLPPHRRRLPRCPSTSPQRDPAARPRASSGETSFLKAAHLDLLPREGWSFAREVEGARGSRCVCTFPQPPSPLSQWTHTHALPRRLPPFSRSGGIGSLLSCCYLFATEDRALRIILCKRPVLFIPSNCLAGHSRVICQQKLLFSFSFQSVLSQTESLTLN